MCSVLIALGTDGQNENSMYSGFCHSATSVKWLTSHWSPTPNPPRPCCWFSAWYTHLVDIPSKPISVSFTSGYIVGFSHHGKLSIAKWSLVKSVPTLGSSNEAQNAAVPVQNS